MSPQQIICLLLLFVSLWGYVQILSLKIRPEFGIGITFAYIGSAMFAAGIIGIMPLAAAIVTGLGVVCLAVSFYLGADIRKLITPGTVFFVLMCCVIFRLVHGAVFVEQDNFTHWAYIAKLIIRNDRFPIQTDPNVLFASYPLGSASFIYYFCHVLDISSEWLQMFAQNMLSAGMVCSLFAFAKNVKHYILCAVTAIFMFACYIGFRELLVDNLLAFVAFGGIAFCIYYKDNLQNKFWFAVPHMVLLMAIKNSGLLFAVYMIVFAFVFIPKRPVYLARFALCSACPFIALLFWQIHVKLAFNNGLASKHSMSLQNFERVFGDKTPEQVKYITEIFIKEVFSLENRFIFVLLFILLAYLADRFILQGNNRRFYEICAFIVAAYVVYQIGQLGMFMFTMPTSEALELASYARYHRTILCYLAALLCVAAMCFDLGEKHSKLLVSTVFCLVAAFAVWFTTDPYMSNYKPQKISKKHHRAILNTLIAENNLQEDAGYLIVIADDYFPSDPLIYCAIYLLGDSAETRTLQEIKDNPDMFSQYPYVIVFSQTDEVLGYMQSVFGQDVPRVFCTSDYAVVQ